LVAKARAGLVVPPGDSAAFAKGLRALKSDGRRRADMGAAGRDFVLQYADAERLAIDYANLLPIPSASTG